jgi:phytoene synthase
VSVGSGDVPASASLEPREILARSGSSFLTGFLCLDAARRAGMGAIYAFCRVVDDAVDEAGDAETASRHLGFWRDELTAAVAGTARTPVGRSLHAAMQRFGVPAGPLAELIDGVAMDVVPRPFADEPELHRYCHCVAAAVGFACLPVLGATSTGAHEYADALGHALQRTNILRDLRGDCEQGRCYVPRRWLAECGVDVSWLQGRGPDAVYGAGGPVARLCARLAGDASRHFARATAALQALPRRERRALVPARIMGAVYARLLAKLQARGGELRGARVRVGRGTKLALALGVLGGVRA